MIHRRLRPHRPGSLMRGPRPRSGAVVLVAGLVLVACEAPAEDEPAPTDRLIEGGADPEIDEEEAELYDDPTRRGFDPDDVDGDLVGTIVREDLAGDDLQQVTYRDKPLHYHRLDQLPGQVTAHGQDDTWSLIGPDGVELRDGSADG